MAACTMALAKMETTHTAAPVSMAFLEVTVKFWQTFVFAMIAKWQTVAFVQMIFIIILPAVLVEKDTC